MIGSPNEGASLSRTLRGMIVSYTLLRKNFLTSSTTCTERFVRESNMVSTTPSTSSAGLRLRRTRRTVFISCERPSSA